MVDASKLGRGFVQGAEVKKKKNRKMRSAFVVWVVCYAGRLWRQSASSALRSAFVV